MAPSKQQNLAALVSLENVQESLTYNFGLENTLILKPIYTDEKDPCNHFGALYQPNAPMLLHKDVALQLMAMASVTEICTPDLSIEVVDALRVVEASAAMRDVALKHQWPSNMVAEPTKSSHNHAIAVDYRFITRTDNIVVPMGADIDDFSTDSGPKLNPSNILYAADPWPKPMIEWLAAGYKSTDRDTGIENYSLYFTDPERSIILENRSALSSILELTNMMLKGHTAFPCQQIDPEFWHIQGDTSFEASAAIYNLDLPEPYRQTNSGTIKNDDNYVPDNPISLSDFETSLVSNQQWLDTTFEQVLGAANQTLSFAHLLPYQQAGVR